MSGVAEAQMKPRTAILVVLCLAACWYYAICYASAVREGLKPGVVVDFYPLWNGSRAILQQRDPYSLRVTEENEVAAYGATAKTIGIPVEQRFAYPIHATFPVMPLGLLDFRTASEIVFWLFAVLTALSVGWLRGKWDRTTVLYCALTFSSYPVIYDLQSRQPVLLFFGLAVGGFALLRAGHLIPAAILAVLSTGKPQIALPILLPMLTWAFARWHERKRFVISLGTFSLVVLSVTSAVSPGWIREWIAALHAYLQYIRPSLVVSIFGSQLGIAVSGILFLALVATLWLHRESNLLFQAAFSVVVFHLIVPYQTYNAVMLLIPVVWAEDNAYLIPAGDWANQLILAAMRVALVGSWIANGVGIILWHTSPLGKLIAWLLPGVMVRGLLGALVVMMLVQVVFPSRRLAAGPGTASSGLAGQMITTPSIRG
jgi:Glycosyltransferase family 87